MILCRCRWMSQRVLSYNNWLYLSSGRKHVRIMLYWQQLKVSVFRPLRYLLSTVCTGLFSFSSVKVMNHSPLCVMWTEETESRYNTISSGLAISAKTSLLRVSLWCASFSLFLLSLSEIKICYTLIIVLVRMSIFFEFGSFASLIMLPGCLNLTVDSWYLTLPNSPNFEF